MPSFPRDAPEATGEEPEDADFDAPKVYEPVESYEVLEERLQMFMAQYNESVRGAGMDLVFFKDAMVHLVKVRWTIWIKPLDEAFVVIIDILCNRK